MNLIQNPQDRTELAAQLTRILKQGLSKSSKVIESDLMLYSTFGNCLITIYDYDVADIGEFKRMQRTLESLREQLAAMEHMETAASSRLIDIMLAHVQQRIQYASSLN